MYKRMLDILVCPKCESDLKLQIFHETDQVIEGMLRCDCNESYPITKGVPRMFIGDQEKLKKNTSKSFGLEWKRYKDYGWKGRGTNPELDIIKYSSAHKEELWSHTEKTFWRKTLLKPDEVKGKLVLDVGVGNGRYAQACTDAGGEVIGIDLSDAVDVAYSNTTGMVNTIQCDIFNLPFRKGIFDIIYSIGVLHHTPNTKKAFNSIQAYTKTGGITSIHLYKKGNSVYEFNDRMLRKITTKLSLNVLWYLCYIPTILGKLASYSKFVYAGINAFIVLRSGHHFNFDWYSAPVAFHHTDDEVRVWFENKCFVQISDDDPRMNPKSYFTKIYPRFMRNDFGTVKKWILDLIPPWALTVRGIKN